MPATFSRIKTWVSNEVLTASDLNAEINNLLNNTIPASIDDYSADVATMQSSADPGGVGTESLATTLAGELTRIRYKIKQLMNGAQWYSTPVGSLSNLGILTANINDLAVTTGKINDLAVTRGKQAALGQQVSATSGAISTTSTTLVDATNLTVTITTTGRPVFVGMIHDGSATVGKIYSEDTSGNETLSTIAILRGATIISENNFGQSGTGQTTAQVSVPISSVSTIDVVAAGTYTYKIQYDTNTATNSSVGIQYAKLIAFEL